ncbi:glycosyltransferase family 4 protein [Nodularia spumigena]|uniref:glycosyltransferase family 4 protein n=1 Tax=Nodularia spumigena TaxID=70799 RepID=UPI00232AE918|nr:glycosyltransferase family 4 protein [Nodularia spumigena]MDB9347413.1 glycosyltransferase family 4 protein [Nodularia spumigena CS-588/01]MDB9354459.1 glycosyltransferase family 4 protein [Nodularia spumigena CS-588/05]
MITHLENQQSNNKKLSHIRVLAALTGIELFGHERGNIEVFLALREQGAIVKIGIYKYQDSDVSRYLDELGFETFHLPFGNQWSWLWLKQYPLSIFEKINQLWGCSLTFFKQVQAFQPTHIHISSVIGFNYIFPALFLNKIPVVYRMGDAPPIDSSYNIKIWHLAMIRTTQVVANSKFIKNKILQQNISKSKVKKIYSLSPLRLSSTNSEEEGKKKSNQLLYVGQLSEEKGLWELLHAVKKINKCHLMILGDSRYSSNFRKELEGWVKSESLDHQITFYGQVRDPFPFYQQSFVHIAPSIWDEPLANVVLEAKKTKIPSVVFPSGGLPEMVRHQIDGYICRDKTPDALAEAIEWMLSDGDRLANMGKSAYEDYETRFGRKRFLREWANIYLEPVKNSTLQ